jgi:hypothetical protein
MKGGGEGGVSHTYDSLYGATYVFSISGHG